MALEPNTVNIFNSPVLSVHILGKLGGRLLLKCLNYFFKNSILIMSCTSFLFSIYFIPGLHQPYVSHVQEVFIFILWWIGLGVLSSIGLGTGLHTFILYLGPHIAKVTLVAYQCNYIPTMLPSRWNYKSFEDCPNPKSEEISFWTILLSVQIESFLWGFGTALGELPPYFLAKAARAANIKTEEIEELEHLNTKSFMDRAKEFMARSLKRHGFITILICASIPNPLFDLAGILCGHFGVSLWVFLGATIIGKAFIKVHIQLIFTIFLFSKNHIKSVLGFIEAAIPALKGNLSNWLESQQKVLRDPMPQNHSRPLINMIWEVIIILMFAFFLVSILNSLIRSEISSNNQKRDLKKSQIKISLKHVS